MIRVGVALGEEALVTKQRVFSFRSCAIYRVCSLEVGLQVFRRLALVKQIFFPRWT